VGIQVLPAGEALGSEMRNSQNITISRSENITTSEETTWSFPGAIVGFVAWLLALAIPFMLYGSNTLFFFLYTWPFFLALMPVAVVVGIALHSLLDGKLLYSAMTTIVMVVAMFGALFMWLMG
jgi:dolichyl-phosphate-mannose--protein O-mannosyl transferase